jgi:2'-5' RNA ligase
MKTRQPLILTAGIDEHDLEPFNLLRRTYFPPDRNFLTAHLTMFHRLPGEHSGRIIETLETVAAEVGPFTAEVTGIRHLGAGVAFAVASSELLRIHAHSRSAFSHWLGGQDMQKWQPHITVQNKVSRAVADGLFRLLTAEFKPSTISITGLDLWRYLDGPWQHETSVSLSGMRNESFSGTRI